MSDVLDIQEYERIEDRVGAVQITHQNAMAVAKWANGTVLLGWDKNGDDTKRIGGLNGEPLGYFDSAAIGDWVLCTPSTGEGRPPRFNSFDNEAFRNMFKKVPSRQEIAREYMRNRTAAGLVEDLKGHPEEEVLQRHLAQIVDIYSDSKTVED